MKKTRIYRIELLGWRLYLCNCRLKKFSPSTLRSQQKNYKAAIKSRKQRSFKQNGGTCDLCGRKMSIEELQMHHILPYSEFPQYGTNPANLEMVCDDCHHAIHKNPYENLQRMEQKAREFGFNLQEYYMKCKKS